MQPVGQPAVNRSTSIDKPEKSRPTSGARATNDAETGELGFYDGQMTGLRSNCPSRQFWCKSLARSRFSRAWVKIDQRALELLFVRDFKTPLLDRVRFPAT